MTAHPVYLLLGEATRRLALLADATSNVADVGASRVLGIDVHHRADTDSALIAIHLDGATGAHELDALGAAAERAGGRLLDLARLPVSDRQKLAAGYLPLYDWRLTGLPGLEDAVAVLAQRVGRSAARLQPAATRPPLDARFRRAGHPSWQLARARNLTLEGVYLATPAPPTVGTRVSLTLTLGECSAAMDATVLHVTSAAAANALGVRGFGVRFQPNAAAQVAALETLVDAARGTDLAATPPPPRRRDGRYPVRLPARSTSGHARGALAVLDVSRRGLFVATSESEPEPSPAPGSALGLALELDDDDGGVPLELAVRVVRSVSAASARKRGASAGLGLEITRMTTAAEQRWFRFIERVSRRVEYSLLVGASPPRMAVLCAALAQAGYLAAGAPDPHTLLSEATRGLCPPDLVVIDASLEQGCSSALAHGAWRAIERRGLRTLMLGAEAPLRSRQRVDELLLAR